MAGGNLLIAHQIVLPTFPLFSVVAPEPMPLVGSPSSGRPSPATGDITWTGAAPRVTIGGAIISPRAVRAPRGRFALK